LDRFGKQEGRNFDLLRIRAIPFTETIENFIATHDKIFVIEMNRDGQLYEELLIELPQFANKLVSVAYSDGMPPTARRIMKEIKDKESK